MRAQGVVLTRLAMAIRLLARLLDGSLLLLIAMYLIGEGLPKPGDLGSRERVLALVFILMLVGLLLAWWREDVGGGLVLGGVCASEAIDLYGSRLLRVSWVFALFALTGLLFLLCAWLRRRLRAQ